jgi:drug/metabolite transporter (DMT)-like permease
LKLHQATGNWQIGLGLAIVTVILWGLLPLALGVVLQSVDVYTVNSFRFLSSFALMSGYLASRRQLPTVQQVRSISRGLLILATLGLAGNYFLFVQGLIATSPSHAEVLIQLAHLFFGLGGLIIFKETYSRQQLFGLFLLIAGLVGFFYQQLVTVLTTGQYWVGSGLLVLAALVWAVYALAQKQLLQQLTSGQVMWLLYGLCGVGFAGWANPAQLWHLAGWQWGLLIFCGLNTFVAYGAFAESLQHWPASRVSAVLALAPIVTIVAMAIAAPWLPLHPEKITAGGLVGALAVVIGSISIALGNRR